MNLTLVRDQPDTDGYTYGTLTVQSSTFDTMERPAAGDHHRVPIGSYNLVLHDSQLHPHTWALVNPALGVYHEPGDVPAGAAGEIRTAILLHPANWASQLLGCIAPGVGRSVMDGQPAVLNSQSAFRQIQAVVPWTNGHTLTIS